MGWTNRPERSKRHGDYGGNPDQGEPLTEEEVKDMISPYLPLPQHVNDMWGRPLAVVMVNEEVIIARPNGAGEIFLDNDMECMVTWTGHRDNGELLS